MKRLLVFKGYNFQKGYKDKLIENCLPLFDNEKTLDGLTDLMNNISLNDLFAKITTESVLYCLYEELIIIDSKQLLGVLTQSSVQIDLMDNNYFINSYLMNFEEKDTEVLVKHFESKQDNLVQVLYSDIKLLDGIDIAFGKYNALDLERFNLIQQYDSINIPDIDVVEKVSNDMIMVTDKDPEGNLNRLLLRAKLNEISKVCIISHSINSQMIRLFLSKISTCNVKILQTKAEVHYKEVPQNRLFEYESILKRKDENFKFKMFDIYSDPYESKEMKKICQSQIIHEIIQNVEYAQSQDNRMRDTFVTAPTGTGKSVMFQIPAIYITETFKPQLVTIVLSPLIGLMNDQVEQISSMTDKAVTINSDYTPDEKKEALDRIKEGDCSILYLSPETLLSNQDITNLIGERKIGLVVVDEAHTVVTWGKSFRPDYWYLGEYLYRLRSNYDNHRFPVVTFTATATINGTENMHQDIIDSLNMTATSYIGSIKRPEIKFEHRIKEKALDYKGEKDEIVCNEILNYTNQNYKTLCYFPYKSHINNIMRLLPKEAKKTVGIYTGSTNKLEKEATLSSIHRGNINVVLATKAFGMGIDIKDISQVYHYAPTGTVADYVQEIGRAARIHGMAANACTDYFREDFGHINRLHGMSSIRNHEIVAVIKKVLELFEQNKTRNFLTNPENFAYIFGASRNEDINNRLKTIFLIIKKDFERDHTINYNPLIFKPRSMFTKGYFLIKDDYIDTLRKTKFMKYFKLHMTKDDLRHQERNNTDVTYEGDVYELDFKKIWEENFSDISFGEFKRKFYLDDINGLERAENILPKLVMQIKSKESSFSEVVALFSNDIEILIDTLNSFKKSKKYFRVEELGEAIYKSIEKVASQYEGELIAQNVLNLLIENPQKNIQAPKSIIVNNTIGMYKIESSTFERQLKEISRIAKSFFKMSGESNSKIKLISSDRELINKMSSNKYIRMSMMLEFFGYATFKITSGILPEFFMRVNNPSALRKIISNENYKSRTVTAIHERHHENVKLMKYLFEKVDTDNAKWDFIEDYFLGFTEKYLVE
ncbi:DEAD/DEAH box helicase [Alkalibacter saccharofermentans]|uniref:ATP-dependent DNA helicase RecQ n=1 Tax=Alkalibacter saccharofermentans DSM 14828 TaxID=1120975 RepID=A0A1M4ZPM8_9FIRM|nr:DEAD/DEAH box helicase [Alkalibacter saccharofermentans]SHF19767.1 ATP-dependent DNA helicase RecQ [Alkalibacter saccharofermentans DSM 14828]